MDVYKMQLHERMLLSDRDISVLRVPGGWIYSFTYHHLNSNEYTSVFVPHNNEFDNRTIKEVLDEKP